MVEGEKTRVRLDRARRRRQILDEAIRLVGDHGYRSFSLAELAARCGMSDAGLLHHFGSKTGLLMALLEHRDDLDEMAVTRGLDMAGPRRIKTIETVRTAFDRIVARNAEQPALVRLGAMLRGEALAQRHPAHDFIKRREAGVIASFAEIVAPFADEPLSLARQLIATMNGLEDQWVREDFGFDLRAEWGRLAAKLLG